MNRYIVCTLLIAGALAARLPARASDPPAQQIEPLHAAVGYNKTLHILFPTTVVYIDLGSTDILAGKADGAENVVRVKAAVRDFPVSTNLTVITEDGGFYTFDIEYAENPAVSTLTVEEPGSSTRAPQADDTPSDRAEGRVLLREVGREKPAIIKRLLAEIYRRDRVNTTGLRSRKYGIEVAVRGIYVHNDVIYVHTLIANDTNLSFEVDCRRFVVTDRKLAKRTARQQTPVVVLRACNDPLIVRGRQRTRAVFALPKLTIPADKVLVLEIDEKNGSRHQRVTIGSKELLKAESL